jgi:hypothetical protein
MRIHLGICVLQAACSVHLAFVWDLHLCQKPIFSCSSATMAKHTLQPAGQTEAGLPTHAGNAIL